MSAGVLAPPSRAEAVGSHAGPGLGRLVAVELRKTLDTPSGFWLQIAMIAATVLVVAVRLSIEGPGVRTFQKVLDSGLQPAAILLPVLGVLLVTSEWTQRTALTTFALVPNRSRVMVAKIVAGLLRAGVQLTISVSIVAVGLLVASPGDGAWSDAWPLIGQSAVNLTAGTCLGMAFGALLLSPAPAVVLLFALPVAGYAVLSLPGLAGVAPWLNYADNLGQMTVDVMGAAEWAQTGTSLVIWMVLPLLAGLRRVTHGEIA